MGCVVDELLNGLDPASVHDHRACWSMHNAGDPGTVSRMKSYDASCRASKGGVGGWGGWGGVVGERLGGGGGADCELFGRRSHEQQRIAIRRRVTAALGVRMFLRRPCDFTRNCWPKYRSDSTGANDAGHDVHGAPQPVVENPNQHCPDWLGRISMLRYSTFSRSKANIPQRQRKACGRQLK